MVIIPNVHFSFRKGGGSAPEVLYGKVELKPTLAFQASTSLVLPAPTTIDLVDGEGTATNVYPTPAPVEGQIEWAYRVKVTDRHSKSFEWMVGVPDVTGTVEFTSLPKYYETRPPAFGKGDKGDPGTAATVAVGTVAEGGSASVTNSGTSTDAVLDFVLPEGPQGPPGVGVPTGGTALQYVRKNSGNTDTEWATLSKASVGLSNVDNTSDTNKPLSTPQKSYIDGHDSAPDGNKLASDLPSSYKNGYYVTLGQVSNGWPAPSEDQNFVIVSTSKARSNNGGVLQWVTAYNDPNAPIMYRISRSNNTWGDFVQQVDNKYLSTKLPMLNVIDFGADPLLVNDSQPAIQAAIDLSVVTGQTVYVPKGSYRLQAPLRSPLGNLHLKLDPLAILERHTSNAMFINGVHKSTVAGGSNILIEGGIWDCRGKDTGSDGSIFALGLGNNIVVRKLLAKNVGRSHVAEIAGCTDVHFEIDFSGWFGTTQEPEAFQIERMTPGGFPYFNRNTLEISDRVFIENCNQLPPEDGYSWWPTAVGGHANQDILGPNRITVRNCDFRTCTKEVLAIDNYTNVVVENVSGQGGASSYILSDNNKTSNVTLRDCTISSTSSAAMLVRRVRGLVLDNCSFTGQYGLWLSNSTDVRITGGECIGTHYDAIIIYSRPEDSPYVDQANIRIDGTRVEGNHGVAINGTQGMAAKAIVISGIYSSSNLRGQGISVEGNAQTVILTGSTLKLSSTSYLVRITGDFASVIASNNFYSTGASLTNNASKLNASNNVAGVV